MNRRQFIASSLIAAAGSRSLAAPIAQPRTTITPRGMFLSECQVPGETRADDVFPADPNGIRLSRNRFLLIYETRGWRGTDDDRSIIYQVRADSFDGLVLKEGIFASARHSWEAVGDGRSYAMCHGHPMAFGVPKGATFGGKKAANGNLFVAKWYKYARELETPGQMKNGRETRNLTLRTMHVEWAQFRLNAEENDLEILSPRQALLPRGETGPRKLGMNLGFAIPAVGNRDATEWIDVHSIFTEADHPQMAESSGFGPLHAIKCKYDPKRHRYDWVETGPVLFDASYHGNELTGGYKWEPSEASIMQLPGGDWAVCARAAGRAALWLRSGDLFGKAPGTVYAEKTPGRPTVIGPVISYRCADGKIRLLSGDKEVSPYQKPRDPLYIWDVDPDRGFAQTNRRVVFDGRATLPQVRAEAYVMADFAKVLPHSGGNTQLILHRVRTWSINHDVPGKGPALLPHEKVVQGIYCAQLGYDQSYPDAWQFS